MIKYFFMMRPVFTVFLLVQLLVGCSTNPATGQQQFAALMSPTQENQVGAEEHAKIIKEHGLYRDTNLQNYIQSIGHKVTRYTERPDVSYKFFVLDSPIVNAFALPGGYIYLSRGALALANSEAEIASVLAHETGHITARHSAERYSRGVVTTLGAAVISAAVGLDGVSQVLGIGSDLYIKSYSRGQESQADTLGIRYLNRSGYDPNAMALFLSNLQADTALEDKISGNKQSSSSYFSTHPATAERVSNASAVARQYPQQGQVDRVTYLSMIDGMVYGDSESQGLVRGNTFYHTQLGFKFSVPDGYRLVNQVDQVIATAKNGALIIFDFADNKGKMSPSGFIKNVWLKDHEERLAIEPIEINGINGATTATKGTVNGKNMTIRLIALQWSDTQIARFQVAVPSLLGGAQMDDLKRATYSFQRIGRDVSAHVRPYRLKVIAAKAGDTVETLSHRMAPEGLKQERFRVLNGLSARQDVVSGELYKIIIE